MFIDGEVSRFYISIIDDELCILLPVTPFLLIIFYVE
jgi:hypothetical protein